MTETAAKLVSQVIIRAPIQKVWDTLTKEGEPLPFFFGSVLHTTSLGPGAPIRMRTPDGKYTGIVGEVLELEPPTRYVHTMKFTDLDEAHCKVSYDLREVEGGVEFTLTTEDLTPGSKTEKYVTQGSQMIADTIKGVVETGKPPFKTRMLLCVVGLMRPFTPKKCRSENWPL